LVRTASIFSARFGTREPPQVVSQALVGLADEPLERGAGEVAVLVVDRLEPRAIHRQQLAAEQVEPPAQQHELAEDRLERGAVGAPEVGDGLEVGFQAPQQPDHLDVAVGLGFQPATGSNTVQVAVDVKLQQIGRVVARPPSSLRIDADKASRGQIQSIDEGFDKSHGILRADVIIEGFREQQCLGSVVASDVRHDPDSSASGAD